jgi:hypothetical protein
LWEGDLIDVTAQGASLWDGEEDNVELKPHDSFVFIPTSEF